MPTRNPVRVKAFRAVVAANLKKSAPKLTAVLRELIKFEYPDEFWQLDFEIHDQSKSPVCIYFFREGFDQVMESAKARKAYPFKQARAIDAIAHPYPESLLQKFAEEDDEWWFEKEAVKEFMLLFAACWTKAGGVGFAHRAMLGGHDAVRRLNLVTGKWTRKG